MQYFLYEKETTTAAARQREKDALHNVPYIEGILWVAEFFACIIKTYDAVCNKVVLLHFACLFFRSLLFV